MDEYTEALASILDPNPSFYRCSCQWRGDQLLYVGFTYHPLRTLLDHGQGVCPACHRLFDGCFAEPVYLAKRQSDYNEEEIARLLALDNYYRTVGVSISYSKSVRMLVHGLYHNWTDSVLKDHVLAHERFAYGPGMYVRILEGLHEGACFLVTPENMTIADDVRAVPVYTYEELDGSSSNYFEEELTRV